MVGGQGKDDFEDCYYSMENDEHGDDYEYDDNDDVDDSRVQQEKA